MCDVTGIAAKIVQIGPLRREDCEPAAWEILLVAAEIAIQSGFQTINTAFLLVGLCSSKDLPHAKRLRFKLRVGGDPQATRVLANATAPEGKFPCSQSTSLMLGDAQLDAAAARRPLVEPKDLAAGFVRRGGGSIGKHLQASGRPAGLLISNLFDENDRLDLERFDTACRTVFDNALEIARERGHELLARSHLEFAFLAREGNALLPILRKLGADAGRLKDLALLELPASQGCGPERLEIKTLSTGLMNVLLFAEMDGSKDVIEEARLLYVLMRSPGSVVRVLVRQGHFPLDRVIEILKGMLD
jgi:hypothetical protein